VKELLMVGAQHGMDDLLQSLDRISRRVGMDGGQRAVVAGVHGLQHVQRFLAADLAHDDPVRPHTEAVDQQLALPNSAISFEVGRARFQTDDVRLLQLQFGSVFDGHDALLAVDEGRKRIEQRGLTGAG